MGRSFKFIILRKCEFLYELHNSEGIFCVNMNQCVLHINEIFRHLFLIPVYILINQCPTDSVYVNHW